MTTSSIAQYLEQRKAARPAGSEGRKEAWTALAVRAAAAAESANAPPRPVPFRGAASPERAAVMSAVPDHQAGRGASALFRAREPAAPPPDIEERLSEAYHRGVQEGLDAARAEAATARALERAEIQKRVVVDRLDFQMNEYAKLAESISQGLKEVERRIADSVEKILKPFLHAAVTSRAVDEIGVSLARLSSAGLPPLLRISGPEPLLKLLKERVGALAVEVDYVPDAQIEIKVEAGHTTIATELGAWADWLDSASGASD